MPVIECQLLNSRSCAHSKWHLGSFLAFQTVSSNKSSLAKSVSISSIPVKAAEVGESRVRFFGSATKTFHLAIFIWIRTFEICLKKVWTKLLKFKRPQLWPLRTSGKKNLPTCIWRKNRAMAEIDQRRLVSGVTQRLGPPQAKPFPAKPPTTDETRSSGSGGVFNRLGASVNSAPVAALGTVCYTDARLRMIWMLSNRLIHQMVANRWHEGRRQRSLFPCGWQKEIFKQMYIAYSLNRLKGSWIHLPNLLLASKWILF